MVQFILLHFAFFFFNSLLLLLLSSGLRETGVSIWLTNPSELRQLAERLAKAQYAKGKDPRHCMMLYLALNKKSMVQALMKVSQESECKKIWQFLSRDFEQEEHRTAALKNAYVLVGQKYVFD
jgi:hypothetical protein